MSNYRCEKVGEEWHVIFHRFVDETPFVMARCKGPVPAGDIVIALTLMETIRSSRSGIGNGIEGLQRALRDMDYSLEQQKEKT